MSSIVRGLRSLGKRIRLSFTSSGSVPIISPVTLQYPVLMPLRDIYQKLREASNNKYKLYRVLAEIDPELWGSIDRIAKMVRYAYQGVSLKVGRDLDEEEKELLEDLKNLEEEYSFKNLFQTIAEQLLMYGDFIAFIDFKKNVGLTTLQPLPIEYMTILEKEDQIGQADAQIFERNIYVLNELNDEKRKIFKKDNILHVGLSNQAKSVRDLYGRYTFGVWSMSPIEALKYKLLWKLSATIDDIIIRQKLIPREHHKLDLSAFDPRFYPGTTFEEKAKKAKEAAQRFVESYKRDIAKALREPDRSYITGKEVEIGFVEPKKVTYTSPNELIEQIDKSIFSVIGPVETALTGRGRRTYATELIIASYAVLCAESIADIIKDELIKVCRRHLREKFGLKAEKHLKKVDIKVKLVLDVLRGESIRQAAVLSSIGIFTEDEIRGLVGFDPLTEEQRQRIVSKEPSQGRAGQYTQTIADIVRDYIRRTKPIEEPVTPESDRERQVT